MIYYSQSDQDKWVLEFLKFKRNGFFIEIGAYDGIQTSNTYTMEKFFDWDGICIEANPHVFSQLVSNRKSKNLNVAVNDYYGKCFFWGDKITKEGFEIPCDTLDNLLTQNECPKNIDYISIDIEGYEYVVLKNFDFSKWNIGLMTVEHNLYMGNEENINNKNNIYDLLSRNGFTRMVENAPCLDEHPSVFNLPYEDWYINNKLL
jgi:FkbM family methyltransferase